MLTLTVERDGQVEQTMALDWPVLEEVLGPVLTEDRTITMTRSDDDAG